MLWIGRAWIVIRMWIDCFAHPYKIVHHSHTMVCWNQRDKVVIKSVMCVWKTVKVNCYQWQIWEGSYVTWNSHQRGWRECQKEDKCVLTPVLQLILLSIPSIFRGSWNMYSRNHITKHPFEGGDSKDRHLRVEPQPCVNTLNRQTAGLATHNIL